MPYCLFFILGFAPFAAINSLWAQLVVFRNRVPEGDMIGTVIGSVYNIANIFPIIYVIINSFIEIPDRVTIPIVIAIGIAASAVLGVFWEETMHLYTAADGHEVRVSWVIYLTTFISGAVGCLLGVVLYSYTARFRPFATTALSFGMGINGVAIQGLGLLQRIGLIDCVTERYNYAKWWDNNPANPNNVNATGTGMTGSMMTAAMMMNGTATAMMTTISPTMASMAMHGNGTLAGNSTSHINGTYVAPPALDPICFGPDDKIIPMHFNTRDFFIICAAQIALSLIAFIIIDRCSSLMKPHEDPDYFFRNLEKSAAEIEHEKLLSDDVAAEEDESALLDENGKVRFSLSASATKSINSAAEGHVDDANAAAGAPAAPPVVIGGVVQAAGVGGAAPQPTMVVDASGVPQPFVRPQQSLFKQILLASVNPVASQFIKAFYTYFLVPGVATYLTKNDTVVSGILFAAAISNMVGRIATGCITIWKLWLLNLICIGLFAYEFTIAAYPGEFPLPSWILIPVTVVMSGCGGYISTQVYMSANRECLKHFNGDTTHAKKIRQYVSLANQIGSLVGTYACLGVSGAGIFQKHN